MENALPKISIVVPSYNQGPFLSDALKSIFSQEYLNLEVIVMDGGSSDESIDVIHKYEANIKFWQSQPDGGQANAINLGMQHCTGEIVAWLNSDDWYINDALWIVARVFQENPDCGLMVGNGFLYREGEYKPFCPRHIAISRTVLREGLDYILQPATFMSHTAWIQSGGLRTQLNYGLDWDLFIRILGEQKAVTINEFLAVSREYQNTKTSSGGLIRAQELLKIATEHTQKAVTLGSAFYLLEALLGLKTGDDAIPEKVHRLIYHALQLIQNEMYLEWNTRDPFPVQSDWQDKVHIPFAQKSSAFKHPLENIESLPKISIIIPSYNQSHFLAQTLGSIFAQDYPSIEVMVFDGGSTDESVDIIKQYEAHLAYWCSEPDSGPAHAINKGFEKATGEIIGWLNSDDMLTDSALWHIAREFMQNPETEVVFGNALYTDENNHLFLANHGTHLAGLYYGKLEPLSNVPYYWTYVHAIPQPTVYFRRYLLKKTGKLDQSYHFIFDFEFFWRLRRVAGFKKIERTLALYRIHANSKTSGWTNFLIELYRFSRPLWPPVNSPEYNNILRSYLDQYFLKNYGRYRRRYFEKQFVKFLIANHVGNPEKRPASFLGLKAGKGPGFPVLPEIAPRADSEYDAFENTHKYLITFCNFFYPHHPGRSGGEIRDFHILRKLASISRVDFFALSHAQADGRRDDLRSRLRSIHDPEILKSSLPDLVMTDALKLSIKSKLLMWLRNKNIPVYGPRYHSEFSKFAFLNYAYVFRGLNHILKIDQPDFLIIGPQLNPLPFQLPCIASKTLLILSSYDVEAIRMERMAASQKGLARIAMQLEARRARQFEHDALQYYDGIIAVSETDKHSYMERYGFEPDRILVLDNSVDTKYFSFRPRIETEQPNIVFTASYSYWPNVEAAHRLLAGIMPLVRQHFPSARAWIVGQDPSEGLLALSDGKLNIVTGKVDDVRPFLDMATATCIPLITGSGTKYKVLEAASAGVPVICTSLALEGLSLKPEEHILVGETNRQLADAIMRVIQNPAERVEAAQKAFAHIEQHYSWNSNLRKLDPWLEMLKTMPKRSPSTPGI